MGLGLRPSITTQMGPGLQPQAGLGLQPKWARGCHPDGPGSATQMGRRGQPMWVWDCSLHGSGMLIILISKRKFTGCNGRMQPCCTPLLWKRGERLIRFN